MSKGKKIALKVFQGALLAVVIVLGIAVYFNGSSTLSAIAFAVLLFLHIIGFILDLKYNPPSGASVSGRIRSVIYFLVYCLYCVYFLVKNLKSV